MSVDEDSALRQLHPLYDDFCREEEEILEDLYADEEELEDEENLDLYDML